MVPSEYSELNERVVALVVRGCRGRVVAACSPAASGERGILQWCELFARHLLSGVGLTRLQSRLQQRVAWHAMPISHFFRE